MGNLVTTVGQESGEGGTSQLLASARNEPEARVGSSLSDRRQGDSSARNCFQAAALRGRTESQQAPSPMSLSLGSRASLVPHCTAHERAAGLKAVQAKCSMLDPRSSRRPNHVWSSHIQPPGAAGTSRPGTDLRRTTIALTKRSPSSSSSSPSSLSPVPEFSARASPSDERRMLPRPRLSNQASAPDVQRPLVEHVDVPSDLPVDAVANPAVAPQGSDGQRRRSQIKRCVIFCGLSLMVTTVILTALTWSILEDPLGGDVERNASYIARLLLLRGVAANSGYSTLRAVNAVNGSRSSFTAAARSAEPSTDNGARLF